VDGMDLREGRRGRNRFVGGALALALIGSLVTLGGVQPAGAGLTPTAVNRSDLGWYDPTGFHDPGNDNYIVGDLGGSLRNFFIFDLSSLSGTVTAVTLAVSNPNGNSVPATYTVYDVSTSAATVAAGGSGLTAIYTDLGTGTALGSITNPSGTLVNVPFNGDGVAYVQAGLGSTIAVGGDLPGIFNYFANSHGQPATAVQLLVTFESSSPPTPSCEGGPPATAPDGYKLIVGTSNNDRGDKAIKGSSGNDLIFALGGDDEIYGKTGDDVICAGSGNDYAEGGDGADTITGEGGKDDLRGQAGNDTLTGGNGGDTLNGGNDTDECVDDEGTVFKNCETLGTP
jgi:Ca2+-binding RTX toxin-like protein